MNVPTSLAATGPRTLFVCQWYLPEPAEIAREITHALGERGHRMEVLTGVPNYPHGVVHPGYKAWRPLSETIEGIEVHRAPLIPSHSASVAGRILNYVSWAVTSAVASVRLLRRSDVALVYSSPATAALGPALWRRILGVPYVVIVQDLWPESVHSSGMVRQRALSRAMERILRRFCDWTYRSAAHVIVISPGMKQVLQGRGVDPSRISLAYNWASNEDSRADLEPAQARVELGLDPDSFIVSYAGNLGFAQNLETIVESIRWLEDPRTILVIAGDGAAGNDLRVRAESLSSEKIRFLGQLSSADVAVLRRASDVQLVSLADDDLFTVTMPSKVQAILSSGTPVIAVGRGDVARVVEESGAGWSSPPGDARALASVISRAAAEPAERAERRGAAARAYYLENMSREKGASRLDAALRSVVAEKDQTS